MVGKTMLRVFLKPGNMFCDLIGASSEDDRSMIRTLINMLVWNFVVVVLLWEVSKRW